ncbi:MAG: hypothetical protein IJA47_03450 [Oscillospiraceae bacterium]|nr:hypothetical protein [Oscillospiraceae bacterium]
MKVLTYKIEGYMSVFNPETKEVEQQLSLAEVTIENPSDEQIAQAAEKAYNGEYTIEDDGQPDPADTPSQLDVIEAQVTYTAMMTDTLLEV